MLWHVPGTGKSLYLTFDDGPTPEATSFVLSVLNSYNAKATFFCVGDNVRKNTELFQRIISHGHNIGNHTFNHLIGWQTDNGEYYRNIDQCTEIIKVSGYQRPVSYFRPPHGKISFSQYKSLCKKFRIVMWDILTMDFAPGKSPDVILKKIIYHTGNGSIIVFHDSEKALLGLKMFLEPFLNFFSREGFQFKMLEETN